MWPPCRAARTQQKLVPAIMVQEGEYTRAHSPVMMPRRSVGMWSDLLQVDLISEYVRHPGGDVKSRSEGFQRQILRRWSFIRTLRAKPPRAGGARCGCDSIRHNGKISRKLTRAWHQGLHEFMGHFKNKRKCRNTPYYAL
jgi:hypothetical protein